MPIKLLQKEVGPWPMNTYLIICEATSASAVVDPGADGADILALAEGTFIEKILITHGHMDHIQALAMLKEATSAQVYINPADAEVFDLDFDIPIGNGDKILVGESIIRALHTPGHTPGMTSFDLGDGRVLVGDTIFVGGPGKTWSERDFDRTMRTMQEIIFAWPDETRFYPGHGPSGVIGEERPAFEAFLERGWSHNLFGDVTWTSS